MEEQWDVASLEKVLAAEFQLELPLAKWLDEDKSLNEAGLRTRVCEYAKQVYQAKVEVAGSDAMHHYERAIMLQSVDMHWREHLSALDHLRQGIHLRGYAQKNPKQEYKREAFELFSMMLDVIKREVTQVLMAVQVRNEAEIEQVEAAPQIGNVQYHHADYEEALAQDVDAEGEEHQPFVRDGKKIGRNDPCPCGSGKKYKQCHGQLS
jgi:preprotein translocase subunit SecA